MEFVLNIPAATHVQMKQVQHVDSSLGELCCNEGNE